jgi:putative cell wall-binding protein
MTRITVLLAALALLLPGLAPSSASASTCNQDVTDDGAWREVRLTFPDPAQAVTGTDKITAFAVDPKDPDVVFATNLSTVLRTVDGGCDWEVVYQVPFDGSGPALGQNSVRAIRTLGVSPHDDTVILGLDTAQRTVPEILRSEQGGDPGTFETIAHGFPGGDLPVPAMPWRTAFDPHQPGVILMLARTGTFAQPGLLLRSEDAGTSWAVGATVNADGEDYLEHPVVAFDPVHRDRVWIGQRRSIERSDDGGLTVALVDVDLGSSIDSAVGVGRDGHSVIVATHEDGYAISRNSGATWTHEESPAFPRRVVGVAVGSGPGDLIVAHSGTGEDAEERGMLPVVLRHDASADAWSELTPPATPSLAQFHLIPIGGDVTVAWAGQRGLHHHPALWRYVGPLGQPGQAGLGGGDGGGAPDEGGPGSDGSGSDGRVVRHSGGSRTATAAAVSTAVRDRADTVLLARADAYADALAGGPLAAHLDGPLLLTDSQRLDAAAAEEIARLGATRAVLLGGTSALSEQVAQDLRDAGLSVERISGADRFATAVAIAERMPAGTEVLITEGANADAGRGWPDALSASGLAAALEVPVLLVTRDTLPEATAEALNRLTAATIIGGVGAVSAEVEAEIAERTRATDRIAGPTRYATAAATADEALRRGVDPAQLWLATGRNWPDGLTAGAAAGATDGILLLIDGEDLDSSPPARDWIGGQRNRVTHAHLTGGTAAITPTTAEQVNHQLR